MRVRPASPIPWFDRKPGNPFVPIGVCAAIARSIGQGRPQAGACASPLTEASTVACSRPFGRGAGARTAILTSIALAMTSGSTVAAFAASVQVRDAPMAVINPADPYAAHIAEASRRFGVPEAWIRGVMHIESRGVVRAVSPKGAIGLMQIMPDTWTRLRVRYGLGDDPYDPRDNILAGAAYLREMHNRYGEAGFLAAYNAGPGRYEDYVSAGRALPAETRAYVATLAPLIAGHGQLDRVVIVSADPHAWSRAPLFIVRADDTPSAGQSRSDGPSGVRSVTDLSGLEPSLGVRSHGIPAGASLFVARASFGPGR